MIPTTTKRIELECSYCHTVTPFHAFKGTCPNCGEKNCRSPLRYGKDQRRRVAGRNPQSATLIVALSRSIAPLYDTQNIVSMGEGGTPLLKSTAVAEKPGA